MTESLIFDMDGEPLTNYSGGRLDVGESETYPIQILCLGSYKFYCDSVANITVEGRKVGDVSWTNLESSYLDVTADDGLLIPYEIQITATGAGEPGFYFRYERI